MSMFSQHMKAKAGLPKCEAAVIEDEPIAQPDDIQPEPIAQPDEIPEEPVIPTPAEFTEEGEVSTEEAEITPEVVVPGEPAVVPEVAPVDETVILDDGQGEVVLEGDEPVADIDLLPEDESVDETEDEGDLLDGVNNDDAELEELEEQMRQLVDTRMAIEQFGMSPGMLRMGQITGLLCGTALEHMDVDVLGLEAWGPDDKAFALESLGDKISDTAGRWAAKILSVAKSFGTKVMGVLTPLWNKLATVLKAAGSKVWDKTKDAGRTIKAHPVATVLAVLGAIAAVAGILAFVGASCPSVGAKMPAIQSFNAKLSAMIKGIKWPFGKFDTSVVSNKVKLVYTAASSKVSGAYSATVAKLGWTQTAVHAVSGKASAAWNAVKGGIGHCSERVTKIAGSATSSIGGHFTKAANAIQPHLAAGAGKLAYGAVWMGDKTYKSVSHVIRSRTGSEEAGEIVGFMVVYLGVVAALSVATKLIMAVVVGGFNLIVGTVRKLIGAEAAVA